MALSRDAFVEALQYRYDYYSARAVASEVLETVGASDKAELSKDDVAAACDELAHDSRNGFVVDHIRSLAGLVAPKADAPGEDAAAKKKAAAEAKKKAAAEAKKAAAEADKKAAAEAKKKAAAEAKKAAAEAKKKAAAEADKKAAAGADKAPTHVDQVFAVKGAPEGQLVVVGNLAELGDWKPGGGLKLSLEGDTWQGGLKVAVGAELEFKYVIINGDAQTWEGGDNHKLVADPKAPRFERVWQA
ncbi:MAG: hypothetical protein CSA66_00875 [Proteobacteria bacterium]|nr:MAG: hypothetical protein CSA66_00875 [Pseudomonadota bacterium]